MLIVPITEPVMPSHLDYLDAMGYPDYEAFDRAMQDYRAEYDSWYEMHGLALDAMPTWRAREGQGFAGRA